MLFAGVPVGFEDPSAPFARIDRAPLAQTVTFVGDPGPQARP